MKITKTTIKKITKLYNIDTIPDTVTAFVEAFKTDTYKVVMEADLCDNTVHFLETIDDYILVFITDEETPEKIIEVYFEN